LSCHEEADPIVLEKGEEVVLRLFGNPEFEGKDDIMVGV
jgi:hypothetical protein